MAIKDNTVGFFPFAGVDADGDGVVVIVLPNNGGSFEVDDGRTGMLRDGRSEEAIYNILHGCLFESCYKEQPSGKVKRNPATKQDESEAFGVIVAATLRKYRTLFQNKWMIKILLLG